VPLTEHPMHLPPEEEDDKQLLLSAGFHVRGKGDVAAVTYVVGVPEPCYQNF
jgi:hypothetical protein